MANVAAAPKTAEGVSPRDRILAHAIELLALHGFEAMTMRQLGDAVGLDNSSLYRHFRSKAELVSAALDRVAGDVLAAVGGFVDSSEALTLQAFEDVCAESALYFFDRPSAARLMLHWLMSMGDRGAGFAVSVPATDAGRPHGKLLALLRDWMQSGARRGVLRRYAEPDAIVILFGAILLRPATYGYLLHSLETRRSRAAARKAWEGEVRAVVRGAFAP